MPSLRTPQLLLCLLFGAVFLGLPIAVAAGQTDFEPDTPAEVDAPQTFHAMLLELAATLLVIWDDFVSHLPLIVIGFIIMLVTWLTARLVRNMAHRLFQRLDWREALEDLISRLAVLGVWLTGLLLTAMVVFPGVTPASALTGLGLGSIAIGFAFKDVFENFFAGILILSREPFRLGDFIAVGDFEGFVEKIYVRDTHIRQVTGERIVVPNAELFRKPVHVRTDREERRVSLEVGISYGTDIATASGIVRDAVSSCERVHDAHPVEVLAKRFGASSIDLEVLWWTDSTPIAVLRSRDEVVMAIKSALDQAGIEIPFPQRTLTFGEAIPLDSPRGDADAE